MPLALIMWNGTIKKRRPAIQRSCFVTAAANSGVPRARRLPLSNRFNTAMKCDLPAPNEPCK